MSSLRTPLPPNTSRSALIAVLRATDAQKYASVCSALVESGVRSIELTLTTPGTIQALPKLISLLGDRVDLGVGTVLSVQDAEAAILAGAAYLVSPNVNLDVISTAVAAGVPILPGAFTPSEAQQAWAAGAAAVKIFPAALLGPSYVGMLRGPFPEILIVPSGGVELDDIPGWLVAGAEAVSVGGPLIGSAFQDGDLNALRTRAEGAVARVQATRARA